jgi:flagellar hook-associated protein 3 FlgL
MTTTSDIGSQNSTQFLLQMLRGRLLDTQRQISTGLKSPTLSGLGTLGTSNVLSFRNKTSLLEGYSNNLNIAKTKFSVMDKALNNITEDARDTMNRLRSQLQGTTPLSGILSDEANTKIQAIASQLNVQVNGQYQFAGDDSYNAPMANTAALNTNIGALIPGIMSGSTTVSSVVAAARSVTGTNLGYSSTVLSSGNVSFRADDSTDIDYTLRASQSGFADIMRGMAIVNNLPQPTTQAEQANYWTAINAAIQLIDEGTKAVDQYQGAAGSKAELVDDLLSRHTEMEGTYREFIGDVEDADVAEASVKLQNLQTQLQASYSIIAQLRDLSLVNFI